MSDLAQYFQLVTDFQPEERAIDVAHNLLLVGAVLSKKPERILELGIGTGFVTRSLVAAVRFNGKGHITSVDNWFDWHGNEPSWIDQLREEGVTVRIDSEQAFLQKCPSDEYDFLISDADHVNSGNWLSEHLRVTRNDGFLFFHDTNSPAWPTLLTIQRRLSHLPHYHFTENSRPDERCSRGWLFVINKKKQRRDLRSILHTGGRAVFNHVKKIPPARFAVTVARRLRKSA
jgi:predicted O-methyltransferase YrrM